MPDTFAPVTVYTSNPTDGEVQTYGVPCFNRTNYTPKVLIYRSSGLGTAYFCYYEVESKLHVVVFSDTVFSTARYSVSAYNGSGKPPTASDDVYYSDFEITTWNSKIDGVITFANLADCIAGFRAFIGIPPCVDVANLSGIFVGSTEIQKVILNGATIYQKAAKATVSGLGSSDPSAVTFNKDGNFTKTGLGIEEVTIDGDTFIKIPTMYRKVNTVNDNQITSFTIANAKIDNDYQPYSCFVDEDGNLLPYILVGKYWNTDSNNCISTTQAAATTMTVATGRNFARARGTGYQVFDWQMQKLWQDLIICLKETINTNTGSGWTYDELGIYWSTSGGWIDGVISSEGTWNLCTKPSKYASLGANTDPVPADYVSAAYSQPTTSSTEIQKLGYDMNNPFFNYPSAITSSSTYNTYYCDSYYYDSNNRPVNSTVGYAGAGSGAFSCVADSSWSATRGVRLCYRPIS